MAEFSPSIDHLTISQLAGLPREKKPLPRLLLALLIVSALAVILLIISVLEALKISHLNASRGIDPASLSVLVWKRNATALSLPQDAFSFDPASNTLELTDLSLATQLAPDNPALSSLDNATLLRSVLASSPLPDERRLVLVADSGNLVSCLLAPASTDPASLSPAAFLSSTSVPDDFSPCALSGLSGPLYKIVEFSAPPAPSSADSSPGTYLGFIYVDGTVGYLDLDNISFAPESSPTPDTLPSVSVSGPLKLSGFVRDIIPLASTTLSTTPDGSETSLTAPTATFVLSDGTYLLFDSSML